MSTDNSEHRGYAVMNTGISTSVLWTPDREPFLLGHIDFGTALWTLQHWFYGRQNSVITNVLTNFLLS